MTFQNIIDEVKRLSVDEQLELYELLADLVPPTPVDAEGDGLTPAQAADLDRRLEEYDAGKAEMRDGEEAFTRLRARR